MKLFRKYALQLLLLDLLILITGIILISAIKLNFLFSDLVIPVSLFTIIALLNLFVFFRGQSRDPASRTMHTLVAMSIKFLLEITLALIWFIVIKKTATSAVIIFFVLYLTFTLFSTLVILKTLNNKSL